MFDPPTQRKLGSERILLRQGGKPARREAFPGGG
jgi:hypothetical protein